MAEVMPVGYAPAAETEAFFAQLQSQPIAAADVPGMNVYPAGAVYVALESGFEYAARPRKPAAAYVGLMVNRFQGKPIVNEHSDGEKV